MTKLTLIITFSLTLICNSLLAQSTEQTYIDNLATYRLQKNQVLIAETLNKLAFYYWENDRLEKAIETFEQSVAINIDIRNNNAVKAIYSNMGLIYTDLGQTETALVFFRKSLVLSQDQKNTQDIITNLINIGNSLTALTRYDEAIVNLNEALEILVQLNNKNLLRTCYGVLAETYQAMGNNQKSMEYFTLYTSLQKQLQQIEVDEQKRLANQKIAESEQKAQKAIEEKKVTEEKLVATQGSLRIAEEINEINKLKIENQRIEIKNQRLLKLIFSIAMVFILIVALFILRSNRQRKKHNLILEKANEEISAKNHKINQSINYAKNIQRALLPDMDRFNDLYSESFIFFKPRDTVSGDFYWFESIATEQGNCNIIAAVDCTGHGVPGAFMSMLGLSFLEETIHEKGTLQPNQILENMHRMIKTALRQDNTGNTDGMDMAICLHNLQAKTINFAGAVNSLVYIQNGKMDVLKADFFGLGGSMKDLLGNDKTFSLQTLDVSIPTTCYIFTDGFADQFGGEEGGKFFMKNFRELLYNIHDKPMDEQKQLLENHLNKWQGTKNQQLDDILIIGFKV